MPGQRYEVELAVSATGVFEVEKLKKDILEIQNAAKSKINAINISVDSTKDIAKLRRNIKYLMSDKDKMDKKLSDIKIKAPSSIDGDFSASIEESVYNIDSAIMKAESKIADFEDYVRSLGSDLKTLFGNAKIDLKDIIDTGDADKALDLFVDLRSLLFNLIDADPNLSLVDVDDIADAEKLRDILDNLFSIFKNGLQNNIFDDLKRGMDSLGLDTTNLEDRLRKALSGNAIQQAIDNLNNKISSVKQKLSNHQYVNTSEIEKERAELNGLISDLEELTTMDSALKRSVSSVKGLLTKEFNQLRINESNTVFSDIKPNTKEWNLIVDKIKEAKDGADQINRILKSSSLDADGNIVERYQVERSNTSGSKKITSQYTKQSDGTLSQNSEKVVADLQKERSAAEAAEKAYNKLWEEAERANKQMDKALANTSNSMSGLSKPKELTSQFSTLENDIANANHQLKNGELTISQYSKKVKELISDYQKFVNIQQKRDVETYNQSIKDAEQQQKAIESARKESEKRANQNQSLKQSQTDNTAKEQLSAYEKIKKLKFEISKTTDTDTLSSLESQLKIEQDRYLNATKILKANSDYFDKDAQNLKITQARLEAEQRIAQYKKNQSDNQAKEQQKANESARKESLKKSESEQKAKQSETDKALKDQLNAYKKIQEIKYKLSYTEDDGERSKLLERQKLYQEEFANAGKILSANSELYSIEQQTNELTKVRLEYEEKIAKYKADQRENQLSSIQNSVESYLGDYKKRNNGRPVDSNRSQEYQQLLDKYKASIDALQVKKDELSKQPTISEADLDSVRKMTDAVEENKNALIAMSAAEKGSTEGSRRKEIDKITKYLKDNTRISEEAKTKLKEYLDLLRNGGADVNVDEIHNGFLKVTEAERLAGNEGKRFLDVIRDKAWYGWAAQIASYFSLQDIIRYFKEGATVVKEFDDGLTNISYTMDVTKSQLDGIGQSVLDLSKDLKSSIDDSMQVAKIYANMNTTAEEIKKLSEPTLIMSNLTGFDASTMADDIQAVTQQFEIAAEDSMHIADVYDTISKNIRVDYAKGIEAIAESVQVAGSTAKMAGLEFEDLAALTGKVVETTRLAGAQVGNGMKTIFTRLSRVGELSDEVDNETLSKASESLHQIGVEVYNADGSYRNFKTIMSELAAKWGSLTDAEKSNISFNIAA